MVTIELFTNATLLEDAIYDLSIKWSMHYL